MLKNILIIPFLLFAGIFSNAPAGVADTVAPNAGVSPSVSQNWAGYVADTSTYTAVGGSWSIPAPAAPASGQLTTDATWVGIGGVKSDDLIQAGTQALVQNGEVTYEAWYELLPGSQHIIPLTVSGGDSVTVSLTEISSNDWYLSFTDNTTGKSYDKEIAYQSSNTSAEWIEEMPVVEGGRGSLTYVPLDNFGTVNFTGGYTVAAGTRDTIQAAGAQSLTMAARGAQTLAAPSSLIADDAFSVSRSSGTQVQQASSESFASSQYSVTRGRYGRGGGRYIVVTFGR